MHLLVIRLICRKLVNVKRILLLIFASCGIFFWINTIRPDPKSITQSSRHLNVSTTNASLHVKTTLPTPACHHVQPTTARPREHATPPCYRGQEKRSQMYNPSTTFSNGTNFPIIAPHIQPNISDKNFYLVVVVNSHPGNAAHRLLRKAIRESWGKDTENNCTIKWRLFFSLGLSTDNKSNEYNHLEAIKHNDVIIGQFKDIYTNIAIKTVMAHWWAFNTFSCRYVLKTDDDVYVRVNKLVHWLYNRGSPGWFFGGRIHPARNIVRDPKGKWRKWYISREQFNESLWPPFCYGAFHVLSTDVLPVFFYYTQLRKPFHTDDAYIGVAARDLGIQITQLPGFTMYLPRTDCQFRDKIAIGHDISPTKMIEIHKTYERLSLKKNIKC